MKSARISVAPGAKDRKKIVAAARRVFKIESQSILSLSGRIDDDFLGVVGAVNGCRGLVIVSGVGKSGIIGGKISSTLSSIGVPSLFVHSAEAAHGDLGMITRKDIVIAISNSGETEEILRMLPALKRIGALLVAMTGNPRSTLAQHSDYVLNIGVREEACSLNIVPTASTTAALAMGDAIALSVAEVRGFKEEDFALNHPGGSLGKRILSTVADYMHSGAQIPAVAVTARLHEVITEMSRKRLGLTVVTDSAGKLAGIITDGDLRRLLESGKNPNAVRAGQFMTRNPKTVRPDTSAVKAVDLMERHSITALVACNANGRVTGIIHLHDLLKAGLA